ncbi:DUF3558 domain-containing protein [Streptomyces sp.]|uniref:DUF3558 domain-containing protein n=1 Tax=Streptomyces sp. TaxID=1931 RepID=UPI002D762D85|nr:DUF3558 domain-containing protein [Streptomyces sp.]HZF88939.1 DUF3558 domain-containing protein [Streptomyces sp.]
MQRKAFVPGTAALLAALLAGCTGGSDDGGSTDGANPDGGGTVSQAAEPGRYRTLPEACGSVAQDTLDALLPGILQLTDEEQREKAYEGEAMPTFDNDRKVGCRWKVSSATATNYLFVDLERVVSYDTTVSDAVQAQQLFAVKRAAADLPQPAASTSEAADTPSDDPSDGPSGNASDDPSDGPSGDASNDPSGEPAGGSPSGSPSRGSSGGNPSRAASGTPDASPSSSASASGSSSATPGDLQPRVLDGLGEEAFLDDELVSGGSTAKQRRVTVAFRTSNVIVTIEYEEQPATVGMVPDSEEMQDRARKLASQLADSLAG